MKLSVRWRIGLGLVWFLLLLWPVAGSAYAKLFDLAHRGRLGWQTQQQGGRSMLASINQSELQSALHLGDEFLAVNGVEPANASKAISKIINSGPNTPYRLTVKRNDQPQELELQTFAAPWPDWVEAVARPLISLLFLVTGLFVFLLKPDDKQAWLLALMLGTVASVEPESLHDLPLWFARLAVIGRISACIFIAVAWHFFLIFPQRAPLLRRFPWLEWALYVPYVLIIAPWFLFSEGWRYFDFLAPAMRWMFRTKWLIAAAQVTALIYMVVVMATLAGNYRAANPLARRKLHLIAAGSGLGLLNFFLMPGLQFLRVSNLIPTAYYWMNKSLILTLPLVPLSFAYAIVRHQVIPVGVLLRRSARYLLVSRGATLLEVLLVILTVTVLLGQLTASWTSPLAIRIFAAAVGIAVWNIARRLHQRYLAPVIDRRFFREAYDAQLLLSELTDQLRTTASLPELLCLVATRIQSALHTESLTILLRDEETGNYRSAFSTHGNPSNVIQLSGNSALVQQLSDNGLPLDMGDLSSENKIVVGCEVIEEEREKRLEKAEVAMLLPLVTKSGLLGIVLLGRRLGDLPSSGEDKKLLQRVAGAVAFAVENARLMERAIADARRRQELEAENEQRAKELEEARQLQLSMLPKRLPQLPHLEIAAYMKTATEVGGDYYDFHLSESGELTVVVGDATGHGLKAGTVVTATKSLFNHLAQTPDIPDIFQHSSRALKQMNLRSMFMAMTMIKLNGYRLTICSAGMPPALIYRAREHRVEEVLLKGIPLGSFPNYVYCKEELTLSPGDVVLLLSDGLPERFNAEGEMLGYDKPSRSLLEVAHRPPQGIIDHFVGLGNTWAGSKPLDDDMTLVVLRMS